MEEVLSKIGLGGWLLLGIIGIFAIDNMTVNICRTIAYRSTVNASPDN